MVNGTETIDLDVEVDEELFDEDLDNLDEELDQIDLDWQRAPSLSQSHEQRQI